MLRYTKKSDTELYKLLEKEVIRQETSLEMIASESIVPIEIMELSGSIFTNKTLEGYPGKRFQTGAEIADLMENLAIERGKELFGAEFLNIQPYSGSIANYCVYKTILDKGDKILSMRLDQGGHLSHGSKANFISQLYNFSFYGINEKSGEIDYDELEKKAKEINPKLIIAGGSAYPRIVDYERVRTIADKVNAYFMYDMAHISGLVAAKVIPSPVPYADFATSSTTKTISGPRSGLIICKEEYSKQLNKAVFPGVMGSMHLNTMAAKAWLFKHCQSDEFKNVMSQVLKNSKELSKCLKKKDFTLVTGGTDTHLILIDLSNKKLTGKEFEERLQKVGINTNKNQIPNDKLSPFITSGLRIGLTSATERGLMEKDMNIIAEIFDAMSKEEISEKTVEENKEKLTKLIENNEIYNDDIIEYILN